MLYNRERTLPPLVRELVLAQKRANSSALKTWARDEAGPTLRAPVLQELEDYRRFFADQGFFVVVQDSGHYCFNDREGRDRGEELRYTLDTRDPQDRWYFATAESGDPYRLNVDFDEKLEVTRVCIIVVVRDGAGSGIR